MAAHGAPRSTVDLDLLTTDLRALETSLWTPLRDAGAVVQARRGDFEDPLAGVVRAVASGERAVDVIVGRFSWQESIIERALPVTIQESDVPVAEPADLILLKLYAGGSQDRWDIEQLLAAQQSEGLEDLVEERLVWLPRECADLWQDLRRPR
jgi:hypothetical protein